MYSEFIGFISGLKSVFSMNSIDKYVAVMAKKLKLKTDSPTAMRVGLQMLQVSIDRIQEGSEIKDFLNGPQRIIPEVLGVYKAYSEGGMKKEDAVKDLTKFCQRYVGHCVRQYNVPRSFILSTGMTEFFMSPSHYLGDS